MTEDDLLKKDLIESGKRLLERIEKCPDPDAFKESYNAIKEAIELVESIETE